MSEPSLICEHAQLRRSCELCEKDAEIGRLRRRVDEIQAALLFWHPGVTDFLTVEQANRAGRDAYLLFGCTADIEPGAADLGWIRWTNDPEHSAELERLRSRLAEAEALLRDIADDLTIGAHPQFYKDRICAFLERQP